MGALDIIFLVMAMVTLAAALMVVTSRNLIHAALWLIVALFGVAVLFVTLEAGFFAAVQVVVYIGAIAILFIFAVMLTRRLMVDIGPQSNPGWPLAALVAALLFGGLVWVLSGWAGFSAKAAAEVPADTLNRLGQVLVDPNRFVLPFELASVLLVAALIGAILVVWERK